MSNILELEFSGRKVNIVAIQTESVQGRHKHTHGGKNINKTKGGKAATKWAIPDNKEKGVLNTGLWLKRTNPFYTGKDGGKMPLPRKWQDKKIEHQEFITWQTWFEITHGKEEGAYTSERADWYSITTDKTFKPTILQRFRRRLIDGTNPLKLDNQGDQLMYYFALYNDWYFLKDKSDRKKYPRTKFLLTEAQAPAKDEYKAKVGIADTMYNLATLRKEFSTEKLKEFGVILKTTSMHESYEVAYNTIQERIIENSLVRGEQKTFCQKFNDLYEILKRKGGAKRFNVLVLLQELVNYNLIGESGGTYTWYEKRNTELEILGKTKEQVIQWLLDPEKLVYRQMLEETLEKSKR